MLNDLFAYVVVFTVLIVGITAYIENTKYKNSSYGKQSTRSFWNILNDKGGSRWIPYVWITWQVLSWKEAAFQKYPK